MLLPKGSELGSSEDLQRKNEDFLINIYYNNKNQILKYPLESMSTVEYIRKKQGIQSFCYLNKSYMDAHHYALQTVGHRAAKTLSSCFIMPREEEVHLKMDDTMLYKAFED